MTCLLRMSFKAKNCMDFKLRSFVSGRNAPEPRDDNSQGGARSTTGLRSIE
jgi:hypothetical protein